MANNQDIMSLLASQQAPAGEPGAMGADETPPQAPMPSPMSTPEPKAGERDGALINVSMALDLIEQSLPAIGSETPEGRKLMQALGSLISVLGPKKQKAQDLQSAEILQLLQNLPQAGGGSMGARQMAAAGPDLGLMSQAPGGMPPGAGAPPTPPAMPPGGAPPM